MGTGAQTAVSVVMPVRNAGPYLDAAVASILAQTHRELELVIGDDGSTDGSLERAAEWARRDSRVKLHRSEEGRGPARSSNWVVRLATHDIVARMDADDLSGPRRLEAQVAALAGRPGVVLVGTLAEFIDSRGRQVRPAIRSNLRNLASHRAPFTHGSIMFRRAAFERAGGYRPECDYWEDQDLYWRMAEVGQLLVLPQVHYSYRYNSGQSRIAADTAHVERAIDLFYRCLAARQANTDYEEVIAAEAGGSGRVCTKAYRALAALQLMSGGRPHPVLLRKLVRAGVARLNGESFLSLGWCAAAYLWPAGLRAGLCAYAYGLEAVRGGSGDGPPVIWAPHVDPRPALPLAEAA